MAFLEDLRRYLSDAASGPVSGLAHPHQRYAHEIRAVRLDAGRVWLTPIGQTFLNLIGRDAVRWLLHLEVVQSLGPLDPFRLSRETAAYLVETPCATFTDPRQLPVLLQGEVVGRLADLHVVVIEVGLDPPSLSMPMTYQVSEGGLDILKEIASDTDTPFKVMAAALLKDETNRALGAGQGALASVLAASSAESIARQARMVAHEMHNALVPVQMAIDGLFEALGHEGTRPEAAKYRERIGAGLARAFQFVNETLRPTALLMEPAEPFDVAAGLRDAINEVKTESEVEIQLDSDTLLPTLVGHRQRFVLAIKNLLRNAAQSGVSPRVQVAARIHDDTIVITVDDDGPGVPEAYRQAIFAPGFSLRAGGSGQGLALLREVVGTELRGMVSCEAGPLGGARFVVILPFSTRGSP